MAYRNAESRGPRRLILFLILVPIVFFAANRFPDIQRKVTLMLATRTAKPSSNGGTEQGLVSVDQFKADAAARRKEAEAKLRAQKAEAQAQASPSATATEATQSAETAANSSATPVESATPAATEGSPTPAGESTTATATASATPAATEETTAAATPTPSPTPAPTPEPDTPIDPATLAKEDVPPAVRLTTAVQFPLYMNNTRVGAVTAPAGNVVKVVSLKPPLLEAEFRQSKQWVPIDSTDFILVAKAIRAKHRAEATPTPAPSATAAPDSTAAPSATPETATTGTASPAESGSAASTAATTSGTGATGAVPPGVTLFKVEPPESGKATQPPGTFPLIQKAIEAAKEVIARGGGVRIVIAGGEYKENLAIEGPETAFGGASLLIEAVKPGAVQLTAFSKESPAISISGAAPVKISGVNICESEALAVKVFKASAPVMLEKSLICNNAAGLLAQKAQRVVLVQCAVANNREFQVMGTETDTQWDIHQCVIASLDPKNVGYLVDGLPGESKENARVDHSFFFHAGLKNCFRLSDASLIAMTDWVKAVNDNGSVWSREQVEAGLGKMPRAQ